MELKQLMILIYSFVGNAVKWTENAYGWLYGKKHQENEENTSLGNKLPGRSVVANRKRKHVLVIGFVRTGKSSLCKTLGHESNGNDQMNYNSAEVCRTEDSFVTYGMGEQDVTIIDTPGIGDDVTTDFKTLERIVRLIKKIGYISLFILTIHGQNPRLTERHQEFLRLITSALGSRYLKSTVVVFTYWEWDEYGEETRKRSGETEEKKTEDINKYFQEIFSISHHVPTLFLDNYLDRSDNKQLCKLERTKDQLLQHIEATPDYSPYD